MLLDAIVLAAGFGRRMGPEMARHQKCSHPYRGRPLVSWLLDSLFAGGIYSAYVVVGHAAEEMERGLLADTLKRRVALVHDEHVRGTAGSLQVCKGLVGRSFLVSEGDIHVSRNSVKSLIERGRSSPKAAVALGVIGGELVPTHRTIHESAEGHLYVSSPLDTERSLGRLSGMYILSDQIWQHLTLDSSLARCIELAYNSTHGVDIVWNRKVFRHFASISDFLR